MALPKLELTMINSVLTVLFVIVCVLLILLVLVQDDGQNGMGGLFGGRGTQAFGSHSATVLSKATRVLVVLFFALSIALAIVNKSAKNPTAEELQEPVKVETPAAATETVSEETVSNEVAESATVNTSSEAKTE